MKKIAITLLSLILIGSIAFAALPNQTQRFIKQQVNTVLEDILKNLRAFNESLPEDRVYAHFDKTLYKPGETIWFSAYIREGQSLKASNKSDIVSIQLINPKGAIEKEYKIIAQDGIAKGDFKIDENAVGGIYKVKVFTNWLLNDKNPAIFIKELTVQKVVLPRLKMKLDFMKKAYGSGDEVAAELSIEDNANQPLANHNFNFVVKIEGKEIKKGKSSTGNEGEAMVKFNLPKNLKSNDGILNIMIRYQGQTESISRSVPIVLNNIQMRLYPEGGDLVTGLASKVAFKALNEFGKPADIEGVLMNSKGKTISSFSSYHQGMGAFSITPSEDETYTVKITKPAGVQNTFELPEAMPAGYVLQVRGVDAKQVYLDIKSTHDEELYLVGMVRGQKHFSTKINAKKGENKTTVPTKYFPIGVAHFTLFDSKGIERAERLAFVNKDKQLNISIKTDKEKYLPREKVKMTIKVADERGMPMPANLSVSVVDDQLLTFADDKSSNILSWMLMEADLRGKIEEPNFYFNKKEEKADVALDYLLMTSGWRRFVWEDIRNGKQPRISYPNERAEIAGKVYEARTNNPIAGAKVTLENGKFTTITDKNGLYAFNGYVLNNRALLTISKKGYDTRTTYAYGYSSKYNIDMQEKLVIRQRRYRELVSKQKRDRARRGIPEPPAIEEVPDEETEENIAFDDVAFDKEEIVENVAIAPRPPKPALLAVKEKVARNEIKNLAKMEAEKRQKRPQAKREVRKAKEMKRLAVMEDAKKKVVDNRFAKDRRVLLEDMDINADAKIDVFAEAEEIEEEAIEEIFSIVETMPTFPTCGDLATNQERKRCTEENLLKHVYKHLRYPNIAKENNIEGLVVVSFVVDTDGSVVNAKVLRDIGGGAGNEALAALNTLNALPKKFTPGQQRGRPVRVRYNLPVRFKLNAGDSNHDDERELRSIPINRNFDLPKRRRIQKLARSNRNRKFYRAREFSGPAYDRDEVIEKRTDFRSTTYWNGNVKIDRKGKAVLEFYNSDAVTSFKITAEGFAVDGMIGRAEKQFFTQLPFSLSAKLPIEVITEDVVKIPLTLVNNTKKTIKGDLDIKYPKGLSPKGNLPTNATLKAGQAKTQYLAFDVKTRGKADKISIAFKSSGFNDEIEKSLTVISKGFPVSVAMSGEAMSKSYPFDISNMVDGSLDAYVTAYPSAMSDMLSGLESMLRQPSGCFEQTSSSTYPNILVLNYLQETNQAKPDISARAKQFIAAGYKRLAGYESASGGFEWFGGDPGHEGLTAYGLMEFVDMKKVYDGVDDAMINRTTEWLMNRRDGMGQFKRNPRALHQFGLTNNETMSIYITWALSEANFTDIQTEVDFAYAEAKKTKNPYQLGLVANILFNRKDETRGQAILDLLMAIQEDEGAWKHGSSHKSAPGSSGNALRIETAALAALATMKSKNPDRTKLKNCMDFIKKSRSSFGGYASTNSTVLALRALVAFAKFSKRTDESGTIDVFVNGKKAKTFNYEKGHQEPIVLAGLESFMSSKKNDIEVKFSNTKTALPYTVAMNYSTALPNSQKECVVKLNTKIAKTKIKVGETVRLKTTLTNSTAEGQPMTMAIVGLPAGLTAQPWQLKELLDKKAFDFYEVIGNNLVFYYRQMKPSEERIINLDLKADIAGSFDAPASSAYLYYTDELKDWTNLERIVVNE